MLSNTWPLIRPLLFALDAETAHHLTLGLLATAPRLLGLLSRDAGPGHGWEREVAGLQLRSPIGLAAGLDKNGVAIPFWPSLGFGFIEVGTVTALPQPGNPRPRMFRLVEERGLINRMGFNNQGSKALAFRLQHLRETGNWPAVPVGANIGKSKVVPLEDATTDYVASIRCLADLPDYFTVNVSSPNTPGLRDLQAEQSLEQLLGPVVEAARDTPVFLKLGPDLTDDAVVAAVDLAVRAGIAGIIATNTTVRRDLLNEDPDQNGGLSGAPIWPFTRERIGVTLKASGGRLPVIGVGGIERADQVLDLLEAGCVAVQLYSAMVFHGPGLVRDLHVEMGDHL